MSKKAFVAVSDQHYPLVSSCLKEAGYRLTSVDDMLDGMDLLRQHEYALLVVEFIPDREFEMCIEQIRQASCAPLLALVLAGSYEALEPFLDLADDALLADFQPKELIVRARALSRHPQAPWHNSDKLDQRLFYGDLCISTGAYRATYRRRPLGLTKTEFRILQLLALHPGQVFSRGQIFKQAWDDYPDGGVYKTVSNHVQRIRKKLEKRGGWGYIETKWGVGYYFVPRPNARGVPDEKFPESSTSVLSKGGDK